MKLLHPYLKNIIKKFFRNGQKVMVFSESSEEKKKRKSQ